ncbi:MAG: DsrE family protein [Halieaceae bacterium]|jgi:intracellular sulfur oxidation DsrE/DsrF family protein|nr:DsrE family protein [Halieaceae bacterium]
MHADPSVDSPVKVSRRFAAARARTCLTLAATALFAAATAQGADYPPGAQLGPVIENYGPVMAVPEGAFAMQNDRQYKVVKDVSRSSDKPDELNRNFDAIARLLNMQARAGMPEEALEAAIVVHGPAVRDLLDDEEYKARFGIANPNTGLLDALAGAGVRIYVCAQTAAARGFATETLNPGVEVALSAMGAHIRLNEEGYRLIPF